MTRTARRTPPTFTAHQGGTCLLDGCGCGGPIRPSGPVSGSARVPELPAPLLYQIEYHAALQGETASEWIERHLRLGLDVERRPLPRRTRG